MCIEGGKWTGAAPKQGRIALGGGNARPFDPVPGRSAATARSMDFIGMSVHMIVLSFQHGRMRGKPVLAWEGRFSP